MFWLEYLLLWLKRKKKQNMDDQKQSGEETVHFSL